MNRLHNYTTYIFLFFLISPVAGFAQVDPASSLLLKPSTKKEAPTLDSSRYTYKPSQTQRAPKAQAEVKPVVEAKAEIVETIPATAPAEGTTNPAMAEKKNVAEEIKEILLGGDEDALLKYKDRLHPEDPRQNIVNIFVAPNYIYLDSSSQYWYRNFYSAGPGISAGAEVWFSPFIGLEANYLTSLSADMTAAPNSERKILVDHRYTNIGFKYRKYSGLSRKSASVSYSVKYSEYQMILPKKESYRTLLNTSGLSLGARADVPQTNAESWFFSAEILPMLKVEEKKANTQVKSGSLAAAYAVKFSLGKNYVVDRKSQIFWSLSHRLDKTIYTGTATPDDPITNSAPEGVSVTTGSTLFEMGYSWGD